MESLAAEINLMLIDAKSGRPVVDNARCDFVTSAAVLRDLEAQRRIVVAAKGRLARSWTVRVASMRPVGDPVNDAALRNLVGRPRTIREIMYRYGYLWRRAACNQLSHLGIVRYEPRRVSRLAFSERWRIVDPTAYGQLRAAVERAVLDEQSPDDRITALVALLHHAGALTRLFSDSKKEAKRRAADFAQRDWASDALRKALDARRRTMVMLNPQTVSGAHRVHAGQSGDLVPE
ncbi:GPP34 family phosphoprotein [Hoyosella sp. YIM 151337]|uniref:GOLPH3/VPS74 family protein n=1 Tax=Hoyosella sp. YIM 151337 TaxID=2992742 RepID=UPI0022369BCB|nr:GPP34 family phosphoprotein [Hoyosella sp. YIM 151337]MCW4354159.1 GPP34 family phosphoprotein [Hoyosella sp. YIM 151337]